MAHSLPALPYDAAALEPHIDSQTMQIHHGKHHAAYVNNLNAALEAHPHLQTKSAEELIADLNSIPEAVRTVVRNNAGGHVNHSMFWSILGPKAGGSPTGDLATEIEKTFGSIEKFKEDFGKAAMGRFGSGWAWLIIDKNRKLAITSTPNQDNPIMDGLKPVLGLDVWEHAYYLHYQNRRADYVAAWWNVIDWTKVAARYAVLKG